MSTSIGHTKQCKAQPKRSKRLAMRTRACRALLTVLATVSAASIANAAHAKDAFVDISGSYSCVGHDEHLGDFKDRHEIRPNEHHGLHSRGYAITGYIDDQVAYTGEAIVEGKHVAFSFASATDHSDHGVLLATIVAKTPITIKGEYFESQFKGGDSGTVTCTQTAK
ncbi:MAG TPA: hypothetical protein VGN31_11745 [Paraburkholderia sp.]